MIKQLSIKNFAIIDDMRVDFDQGMIALTGETGAGKSIIIDALSLLLGERASSEMVRFGANKAYIEGVFYVSKEILEQINQTVGGLEDGTIIIQREVDNNGRSTIRLNSRITTISIIKSIMGKFIDIHSQHDSQYLLDKKNHLPLLDTFAHATSKKEFTEYQTAYHHYQATLKRYEEAKAEKLSEEQMDFFKFQMNEIEKVDLKPGEMEELELELKRLQGFEKLHEKLQSSLSYLKEDEGILDLLYRVKKELDTLNDDPLFSKHINKVNDLFYSMEDFKQELDQESENLYFDESRFTFLQERLFAIAKLKRKYGNEYDEIQNTYETMKQKVDQFENSTVYLEKLSKAVEEAKQIVFVKGKVLTDIRKKVASSLAKDVIVQLKDLVLPHAQFEIAFQSVPQASLQGLDEVEFLVSLNPGQPLRSLIKVASGGEISRLMLGLKVVFNRLFGILTVIFDEVDTGVSGQVASSVGKKMKELSENSQVLCITHLPQVASIADHHYHVYKEVINDKTNVLLKHLNEKERIIELAKMLSGDNISEASLENAKELLFHK